MQIYSWFGKFQVWNSTESDTLDIEGLAQDCSNSSALAMELLQSCAKPSICPLLNKKSITLSLGYLEQSLLFFSFSTDFVDKS